MTVSLQKLPHMSSRERHGRSWTTWLAAAAISVASIAILACAPAMAHPHVWVTSQTEVVFDADQNITGLRHVWTFDEAYSAYVTQGLDSNGDGIPSPEDLQELAELNTASLVDFDYFTEVKTDGRPQAFGEPADSGMVFENGRATLSFTLPLAQPAKAGRVLILEVYDPTFFVSFRMNDGDDAVRFAGGPEGCAKTITRPAEVDIAEVQNLSESFFEALTAAANFGEDFANRALIACP
jgi:ABC-type uncharacterized transport system substrate-binding protein